jgi:hypothetical protein
MGFRHQAVSFGNVLQAPATYWHHLSLVHVFMVVFMVVVMCVVMCVHVFMCFLAGPPAVHGQAAAGHGMAA